MATQTLTAILKGQSKDLESSLNRVATNASFAANQLDEVGDSLSNIAGKSGKASKGLSEVADEILKISGATVSGSEGVDKLDNELSDVTINAQSVNVALSDASEGALELAGASGIAQSQADELGDEMSDASGDASKLGQSLNIESLAAMQAAASNKAAASAVDDLEDEADAARNSMLGAAGAAEILSLQGSALSINVGAFTVALRNLTTQIPMLVATLGNLATAFIGVAGAAGLAAAGVAAVGLAGLAAEAESLAGSLQNTEQMMQAMQAIGSTLSDMFIEAIQPLVNAEGVVAVFRQGMEELMTTVNVFSQSIARAFEGIPGKGAPLAEFMETVSDAWMANLGEMTRAFEYMMTELGTTAGDAVAGLIENFAGFVRFVTDHTNDVLDSISSLDGVLVEFISSMMNLGTSVADGVVPVLAAFFQIAGNVASAINDIGSETIATVAQVLALVFAISRLSGIMGSLLLPLSAVSSSLLGVAGSADTFGAAFFKATGRFNHFVATATGGFGRLVTAMSAFVPQTQEATGVLSALGMRLNNSASASSRLSSVTTALSTKFGVATTNAGLYSATIGRVGDKTDDATSSLSRMRNRLSDLTSIDPVESGFITTSETDIGETTRYQERLEGLDAVKYRMRQRLSGISDTLTRGASRISDSVSALGESIAGIRSVDTPDTMTELVHQTRDDEGRLRNTISSLSETASRYKESLAEFGAVEVETDEIDGGLRPPRFSFIGPREPIEMKTERKTGLSALRHRLDQQFEDIKSRVRAFSFPSISGTVGGGFTGLRESANSVKNSLFSMTIAGNRVDDSLDSMASTMIEVASYTELQTDSADEMKTALSSAGYSADLTEDQLRELGDSIEEIATDGKIAAETTEELSDELQSTGLSATVANRAVHNLGDEYVQSAGKAGVLSRANAVLSGSFTTVGASLSTVLLPALGALAAAFSVLVVVGGAITAVLAMIGESGESASDIIGMLHDAAMRVADTALPFFTTSAELVLDVLNSITAVGGAVMGAFNEIAVGMGLASEASKEGKSGFDGFIQSLDGFISAVSPVLDAIGDMSRYIAGQLIVALRRGSEQFSAFLETLYVPQVMNVISGIVQRLAGSFGSFEGAMRGIVSIIAEFISGLVKLTAILAVVGTVAGVASLGVGGFAAALWSAIAALVTISSPISGTAAAILALVGAIVVVLEYFGVFDAILGAIALTIEVLSAVIGGIVGLIWDIGEAVYNFLGVGVAVEKMAAIWDSLSSGIGAVANAIGVVIDVAMAIANVLGSIFGGVVMWLVNTALRKLGQALDWVVRNLRRGINAFLEMIGLSDPVENITNSFERLIDVVSRFPDIIDKKVGSILDSMENRINQMIGFVNDLIKAYNEVTGNDMEMLGRVELGESGQNINEAVGGASRSARDAMPEESKVAEEDFRGGVSVVGNMTGRDSETATPAGTPTNIEYSEGETKNHYNQNIQADPEDKNMLKRTVKDAMEEANSFRRQQQGHGG